MKRNRFVSGNFTKQLDFPGKFLKNFNFLGNFTKNVDFTVKKLAIYSYFWANYFISLQKSPLSNILPVHNKI